MNRWRSAAAAATALSLAGLPALAVGPGPAPPTASSSPSPQSLPVTVQLTRLTPLAPQPADTVVVTGTLHNDSPQPVSGLQLQLLISHEQIGSRGTFDTYADAQPNASEPSIAMDVVPSARVATGATQLAPDASTPFRVSVKTGDLHLPTNQWQVHALAVDVTGLTTLGTQTVGRLRTFLPWAPIGPGVGYPTQVAWIWPLVDRPHRAASAVWLDDDLSGELAAGGRLSTLVAAGLAAETQHPPPVRTPRRTKHRKPAKPKPPKPPKPSITPVPVTWAIDPMLVDDATAMAAGYRVVSPDGPRAGRGTGAAASWLASLRTATTHGVVLSLPYADPDLVAAVRGGLSTDVQIAISAGEALLERALQQTPLAYTWPPDGVMDQHTLDTLFAGGVNTVILDDTALPVVGGPPNETPSTHTIVNARDGNLNALLVDTGLSKAVMDGANDPADAALDVQRVMSELLMIQAEQPFDQRTIVIAPDRRWAPREAYAADLLADSGRVPWIAPVSLAGAVESPVYDKVRREPLTVAPPPAGTTRPRELPRSYVRDVRRLKATVDTFAAILPPGNQKARSFDDALLRALSSAWRLDLGLAARRFTKLSDEIAATMREVRIASRAKSLVTLTSHSGTVPVTVANDLDTPVRVVVGINAGEHLVVTGSGRVARTIPAHRQVAVDLRAAAKTSGVFPLRVALYTPGGRLYGEPVDLLVRSTAYGAVALLITGGATLVLLVAVAIRLLRRGVHARRAVRSGT